MKNPFILMQAMAEWKQIKLLSPGVNKESSLPSIIAGVVPPHIANRGNRGSKIFLK